MGPTEVHAFTSSSSNFPARGVSCNSYTLLASCYLLFDSCLTPVICLKQGFISKFLIEALQISTHPRKKMPHMLLANVQPVLASSAMITSPLVQPTAHPSADRFGGSLFVQSAQIVLFLTASAALRPPTSTSRSCVSLPCGLPNYTAAPTGKQEGHAGSPF